MQYFKMEMIVVIVIILMLFVKKKVSDLMTMFVKANSCHCIKITCF